LASPWGSPWIKCERGSKPVPAPTFSDLSEAWLLS
jgi:uncharacterized protein (DUF111 family)